MNFPKRSSFESLLKVYTLSEILLWMKPSYFSLGNACDSWSGCLARRPLWTLCHEVNLPASCEDRRQSCHKVNLLSCVARRPLFRKVNLPRCEAQRRLFTTGLNSMIYIIYILLPCFCIIFRRLCSVFNKTASLSANPQI